MLVILERYIAKETVRRTAVGDDANARIIIIAVAPAHQNWYNDRHKGDD